MIAKGKVRELGNSLGIRLSKSAALQAGLKLNEEVVIEIKQKFSKGKDIFGTLERKVDTEKALREIDEMFGE